MSAKIERTGPAIRAALHASSPSEATVFEDQFRDALTRAASTLDVSECQALLDRWWGVALLRSDPPSAAEQSLTAAVHAGEDAGWPSPQAWQDARAENVPF